MNLIDIDIERRTLGCVLRKPSILPDVRAVLPAPNLFTDRSVSAIYSTMMALSDDDKPFDTAILGSMGHSWTFMVECIEAIVNPDHAVEYAVIVKDLSRRRKLRGDLKKIDANIEDSSKTVDELVAETATITDTIDTDGAKDGPKDIASLMDSAMDTVNDYAHGIKPEGMIKTGFPALDDKSQIMPGDLVVVGGWTSQGKTQLALQVALYNAVTKQIPTVVFSMEMTDSQVVMRLLSALSGVNGEDIRQCRVKEGSVDYQMIEDAKCLIAKAPIYIYDDPSLSIAEIKAIVKKRADKDGVGLVVVDYVQLIRPPSMENRQEQVASISRDLKRMAGQCKVPVLALSQLTDLPVGMGARRPKVSDMRESKAIAHDANTVFLIYHPAQGDTMIIIDKQRDGMRGEVVIPFRNGVWQ